MPQTTRVDWRRADRRGFTLVEMLVAVGLLLVIMVIFAQIFQLAVTAMTTQKGLANNNQRIRTAFSVLDADLKRMSYRAIPGQSGIVPLVPGLEFDSPSISAPQQRGYFYYSENDPDYDADDVLQFTVDASLIKEAAGARRYARQQVLPYYGRGQQLSSDPSHRDQPDWDDGSFGDGVATSRWAEVSYFLRHGILYRRVMLIRDTNDGIPANMGRFDDGNTRKLAQPGRLNVDEPYDLMRDYTGDFYEDFDFSAHRGISPYNEDVTTPFTNGLPLFHGSLSNERDKNWPLGVPHFRFGFRNNTTVPLPNANGRPREFLTDAASGGNNAYIGRFTHEETSNSGFGYPRTNNDVYGATVTPAVLTELQNTGRISTLLNGPRRGADILLTNVHSFDVEIWDPTANAGIPGFVDINGSNAGDFAASQKLNTGSNGYGSTNGQEIVSTNVFDTWHSVFDINAASPSGFGLTQIGNGQPPFVPKKNFDPDGTPGSGDEVVEAGLNWRGTWQPNTDYSVGDLVIPTTAFLSTPAGAEYGRINQAIVYRCVVPGWSAEDPAFEPEWSRDANLRDPRSDGPNSTEIAPGVPKDPAQWEVYDNRKPIRAIRITVRVFDPTSGQFRQTAITHSFNESDI